MQRRRGATYFTAGKTDCTKVESNPERLGTKPNVITIRPVDDMKQYEYLKQVAFAEVYVQVAQFVSKQENFSCRSSFKRTCRRLVVQNNAPFNRRSPSLKNAQPTLTLTLPSLRTLHPLRLHPLRLLTVNAAPLNRRLLIIQNTITTQQPLPTTPPHHLDPLVPQHLCQWANPRATNNSLTWSCARSMPRMPNSLTN